MATNTAPRAAEEPQVEERADDDQKFDEERVRLARAVNDLEAAKARVERDARSVHEETRMNLVSELLPVLDNFDRAIEAAQRNGDAPAVVDGMRMIQRQLAHVLEGYGLARFDAVGAAFDPAMHDATGMIPVDDPARDRIVVAQEQPGYKFGARLLRAAKVIVGKHA